MINDSQMNRLITECRNKNVNDQLHYQFVRSSGWIINFDGFHIVNNLSKLCTDCVS